MGANLVVHLFHADPARAAFHRDIDALIAAGVPVHTCITIAAAQGATQAFRQRGLVLEYARDAFLRYALEGATVIGF